MSFELDTEILNQQKETTSSMADLYGYSVFSDDFKEKLTLEYKRQKEERSYYFDCVFRNVPEDKTQQVFEQVFATQTQVVVKEDFEVEEDTQMSVFQIIGCTLLGGLLSLGVWMVIEKIRKGKKIREDYDNR